MKTSLRLLNAIGRASSRSQSTSFIGLGKAQNSETVPGGLIRSQGRMGHEMAYNLFSKQFAQANESEFVVCDAIPECAQSFRSNFMKQYPGAKINVANTPEE